MSILTVKQTWKRAQSARVRQYAALRVLTLEQAENVRLVIRHLVVVYGSAQRLAREMGVTVSVTEKASAPSRHKSARLAFILARVAGVGVDDVLAGRWQRHSCPECGHVGAHLVVR